MLGQTDYRTFEYELARRWAPVHWQETHTGRHWKSDLITAVDFDGDWKTIGNWDAMDRHDLLPVVYFSVVESQTHWFTIYAFYHPRDWAGSGLALDQHENDMEGLLAIIEKPGPLAAELPHGQLVGLITIAHNHFYSYSNVLTGNHETIDGRLFLTAGDELGRLHPCTRQEDEGHGCYALQPTNSRAWANLGKPIELNDQAIRRAFEFPHGSGVRYVHGAEAQEPQDRGSVCQHDYTYVLLDIFQPGGFWERRLGGINQPFTAEGRLAGREFEDDKASPPWKWDDKDDGSSLAEGSIATDPASLVWHYFGGLGEFSHTYVKNPYTAAMDGADALDRHAFSVRGITGSTAASLQASKAELKRQLRSALDPQTRPAVVASLTRRADESPAFQRRLVSAAREAVRESLVKTPTPRGPDASQRAHLSIPAVHVLGSYGDKASRPMLVKLIAASTDRDVLVAAIDALRQLAPGHQAGLKPALESLMHHGDHEVRLRASLLYGETLGSRYPDPLSDLADDLNADVRAAALVGLGGSKRQKDRRLLSAVARDESQPPQVRAAATRAGLSSRAQASRHRPRGLADGAFAAAEGRLTDAPLDSDQYSRSALFKARAR